MNVFYYVHFSFIGIFIYFTYFFTLSASNGEPCMGNSQEYLLNERIFETMERLYEEPLTNSECAILSQTLHCYL